MQDNLFLKFVEFSSESRKKYKAIADESRLELVDIANSLEALFVKTVEEKKNILEGTQILKIGDYPEAFKRPYPSNHKLYEAYESLNVLIRRLSQIYCAIKIWLQFNSSSISGGGDFEGEVQTEVMNVINRVDSSANSLLALSFDGVVKRSVLSFASHLTPGNDDVTKSLIFIDKKSYTDLLSTVRNIRDDILQVLDLLLKNDEHLHYTDKSEGKSWSLGFAGKSEIEKDDEGIRGERKESSKSTKNKGDVFSTSEAGKRKRRKIEDDDEINGAEKKEEVENTNVERKDEREKENRGKRRKRSEEERRQKKENDDGDVTDDLDDFNNKPQKRKREKK